MDWEIYSSEERYRLISRESALIEEERNQEKEGEMSLGKEDQWEAYGRCSIWS